jgi:diguanylate cyclase (GGDEF)-like protein
LWLTITVVAIYGLAMHGLNTVRYLPEVLSLLIFAALASWQQPSRKLRSIAASLGMLTAAASLVDISGGLTEMHFAFFVVVVVLTVYEDWIPFLLAVGFVLLHHGIMGTLDPRAVFSNPAAWANPWAWAALHAMFVALAGVAGVTAWRLNEQVRARMRATQEELERIGATDSLTGLYNRRRLMADLAVVYERRAQAALAIFDLDGFKDYNDRFGHPAGDSLLARLAGRLQATVGASGHAYRLGGDEFCVLVHLLDPDQLEARSRDWTSAFSEHGEGFTISASTGTALIPDEATDASDALRLCDRRMYMIKNSGRATAATQTKNVLLAALSARHSHLDQHLHGVAAVAVRVGHELGLTVDELEDLLYAAELHDVGKVAVPDSIVSKPGPLDEEEWEFMRRHTVIGQRILDAAPSLARVGVIVRATHEHVDGRGYPDQLQGERIPLAARIISVCDAYDAMTSPRPYRKTLTHPEALAELYRCAGAQFDAVVVETFVRVVGSEPPERHTPDAGADMLSSVGAV